MSLSLRELKIYLQKKRVVSLFALSLYFDADVDILKDMLEFWIQKKKLSVLY